MTRIKICGITNSMEIGYLNRYLPDYAGFVFASSRRKVSPERAAELGAALSPTIRKVGVFVDCDIIQAAAAAERAGLDVLQLHGAEDAEYIKNLRPYLKSGMEIWKALRLDADHMPSPGQMECLHADRLLLDTYVAGVSGGTGRRFEWGLVAALGTTLPVILAGGLNPDNVGQAVEEVAPYAVDTSSGVESECGKDEQKLMAFIKAIRGGINGRE